MQEYGGGLPDDIDVYRGLLKHAQTWQAEGRTTVPGSPTIRLKAFVQAVSTAMELSLEELQEAEYTEGVATVDGRELVDNTQADMLAAVELRHDLLPYLEFLTERQREVLSLRYGLIGGACYGQDDIAELLGVERKYVRYHEEAGLSILRKLLGGDGYRDA
jgi:DNA-directed RNA polymerase sigma subunit (sigma70/sigma32)